MKTLYACVAAVLIPCLAFGGMWMAGPGKGSHASGGASSPTPELGWWKFTEGSGTTAADSCSGTTHTVTFGTGATWVTGKSGSGFAIQGNGTNRAGASSVITWGTNKITVCFWFYAASWPADFGTLISCGVNDDSPVNFFILNYADNDMRVMLRGASASTFKTLAAPTTGAWHHMAVVFDNSVNPSAITIYYDNVLSGVGYDSQVSTSTSNFTASNISIAGNDADDLPFAIRVDDLRVYNRALNSTEIGQVYNDPK